MQNIIFLLVIFIVIISLSSATTSWLLARAKLKNADKYFEDVMQETIYEMERRQWASMELIDFNQTLNQQMYDWLVSGTVTYKNGFLVSIQSIDLTDLNSNLNTNADNPAAIIRGTLNMRDVSLGYDIVANLTDGVQHFTTVFAYNIEFACSIEKRYNTNTTASTARLLGMSLRETNFMPTNKVTEILSRNFVASLSWDGVARWGTELIASIMSELEATKYPFPEVCFNHC